MSLTRLRFIDLFAGVGGFHVAMQRLGHRCVLAVEIEATLRQVYQKNFGITPQGDIRDIPLKGIPEHDILCAGFPCQPFSKAGSQSGLACEKNGSLAAILVEWVRASRPRYLLLENVPNFLSHDKGRTWRWLSQELRHAGYSLDAQVLSPHQFDIPQVRDRLFIVGSRDGLDDFNWPTPSGNPTSIRSMLDEASNPEDKLTPHVLEALGTWEHFLNLFPRGSQKPWFPIWAAEFGANYPFSTVAPLAVPPASLRQFRGSFGVPLEQLSLDGIADGLPPYARTENAIPAWKARFLQLNRDLYEQHRAWIDPWLPRLMEYEHSFQKFEWNFDADARSLWDTVIQLRGSGIRAKAPSAAPALVAASSSQVPIIAWKQRYMSIHERARLQDLGSLRYLPMGRNAATRALGNAVNARVVELIGQQLLRPRRTLSVAA